MTDGEPSPEQTSTVSRLPSAPAAIRPAILSAPDPALARSASRRKRNLFLQKALAHGFLIFFIVLVLIPFEMVVVASFRTGDFAPSRIFLTRSEFSLEHWDYVLGIPYEQVVNPATGEKRMVTRRRAAAALVLEFDQGVVFARQSASSASPEPRRTPSRDCVSNSVDSL